MAWLAVGTDVERMLDDMSDIWTSGKVIKIQDSDLATVQYDDGELESDVPVDELRPHPMGKRAEVIRPFDPPARSASSTSGRAPEPTEQEYVVPKEAVRAAQKAERERPKKGTDEGVVLYEAKPQNSSGGDVFGAFVWSAGFALAQYFVWRQTSRNLGDAPRVRVIELGAGTGIVGLQMGLLGASVLMTDGEPELVELLRKNVIANSLQARVRCRRLWFGDSSTYVPAKNYDIVVAADVLYEKGTDEVLPHAFDAQIPAGSGIEGFMSYEHRPWGASVSKFFTKMLTLGFTIERLQDDNGDAVACTTGDPPSMYDECSFVELGFEMLHAIARPCFGPKNKDRIQIFRLLRPLPVPGQPVRTNPASPAPAEGVRPVVVECSELPPV